MVSEEVIMSGCHQFMLISDHSAHPYNVTTAAGRGLEQGRSTNVYLGTQVNVGENYKVYGLDLPQYVPADCYLRSFMAHPETLLPMPEIDDPIERFVSVVKFYLSGWHIKPPYTVPACVTTFEIPWLRKVVEV